MTVLLNRKKTPLCSWEAVLFSPSVRRQRCSQVGQDVLRQDALVLRYAPRVILTKPAQKLTPFSGKTLEVLAPLQLGTTDAQTILKRFTRSNYQHPTYRAIVELGKAIKTVFLCRFLHDEALRQEIHDGLQVIENWNSANDFILDLQ